MWLSFLRTPCRVPEDQEFVFLPKPFSLKQLIETVKGVMN